MSGAPAAGRRRKADEQPLPSRSPTSQWQSPNILATHRAAQTPRAPSNRQIGQVSRKHWFPNYSNATIGACATSNNIASMSASMVAIGGAAWATGRAAGKGRPRACRASAFGPTVTPERGFLPDRDPLQRYVQLDLRWLRRRPTAAAAPARMQLVLSHTIACLHAGWATLRLQRTSRRWTCCPSMRWGQGAASCGPGWRRCRLSQPKPCCRTAAAVKQQQQRAQSMPQPSCGGRTCCSASCHMDSCGATGPSRRRCCPRAWRRPGAPWRVRWTCLRCWFIRPTTC